MTDKKKADQQASPKKTPLDDTTLEAQRARLLERLQKGPIDTITARRELNLLMPAARIKELREAGHPIKTHRITTEDDQGRLHRRVALYFIGALPTEVSEARP